MDAPVACQRSRLPARPRTSGGRHGSSRHRRSPPALEGRPVPPASSKRRTCRISEVTLAAAGPFRAARARAGNSWGSSTLSQCARSESRAPSSSHWTTSDSSDRYRAGACFALAEQASEVAVRRTRCSSAAGVSQVLTETVAGNGESSSGSAPQPFGCVTSAWHGYQRSALRCRFSRMQQRHGLRSRAAGCLLLVQSASAVEDVTSVARSLEAAVQRERTSVGVVGCRADCPW